MRNLLPESWGATSIATVHDGDPYTEGLSRVVADTFASWVARSFSKAPSTRAIRIWHQILTEIAVSDPDVIYLPLFEPEINFFAAQMQHFAGLEDAVIIGGGASFVAGFPETPARQRSAFISPVRWSPVTPTKTFLNPGMTRSAGRHRAATTHTPMTPRTFCCKP